MSQRIITGHGSGTQTLHTNSPAHLQRQNLVVLIHIHKRDRDRSESVKVIMFFAGAYQTTL